MLKVHVPLPAEKVARVRNFIDDRFRPMRGQTLNVARSVAHCALDQILVGNYVGANAGIAKLDSAEAREFRACLKKNLAVELEIAA